MIPDISICIASRNHASLLYETLTSIFNQDVDRLEVIVTDDGSTDETQKILDMFPVTRFRLENDQYHNAVRAKNNSLMAARGDIVIQQSDDVIHAHPRTIRELVDKITPGKFCISTVYDWDAKTGKIVQPYTGLDNNRPLFFLGSCWRKDVCSVGGYDMDFADVIWYDDNWHADGLTRGLGLSWDVLPVLGLHQAHYRPSYDWSPARKVYNEKCAKAEKGSGTWIASGGPWPFKSGVSANALRRRMNGASSLRGIWDEYCGESDKDTRHSYIEIYSELFAPYRDGQTHLLEIGIGGGDCLCAWNNYFVNGEIVGLDLWTGQQLGTMRLVSGDATSNEVWAKNFSDDKFDIIIDDASHKPEDQIYTFGLYRSSLRQGGIYVIEDVQSMEVVSELQNMGFKIYDRRHVKGTEDDILAVWRHS
jgi:glycosyltransferase involved in cell wall biosynthesis